MSTSKQPGHFEYRELANLDFGFDQAFGLQLEDGETIDAIEILRLMPKKRLVAKARWRNQDVIAKFFFDGQHALQHINREEKGSQLLQEKNILTPAVLHRGATDDRRVHVLVYEYIVDGSSLGAIWRQQQSSDNVVAMLKSVIEEVVLQHVLGIVQKDCHLDNFMFAKGKIYNIDTAQIKVFPLLLSTQESMASLALFLSQLGAGHQHLQIELYDHYVKTRGWVISDKAKAEIVLLVKKANQDRWQAYQKKIVRNATEFKKTHSYKQLILQRRDFSGKEVTEFLKNPEAVFNTKDSVMLKKGRSSTVIKISLDDKIYVVKRFNLKNIWHRLRRCLRPTRALHDWRIAQKLEMFGIKTARPLAMIENRFFSLRGKSYFVMEYVEGPFAHEYMKKNPEQRDSIAKKIVSLLKSLIQIELSHGDLKITNIIVDAKDDPVLIDLDGSQEHVSLISLQSAWKKELKRFLRNFDDQEDLKHLFIKYMEFNHDEASTKII